MELYAVFDTKGEGRLVGVFASEENAVAVQRINRHYFRVHRARLNKVNPAIVEWAYRDEERRDLERLVSDGGDRR